MYRDQSACFSTPECCLSTRVALGLPNRGALKFLLPVAAALLTMQVDVTGGGEAGSPHLVAMEIQSVPLRLAGMLKATDVHRRYKAQQRDAASV